MSKRRALLIGVPEYDSESFNALPVVRQDLNILEVVLKKSGFNVQLKGLTEKSDTSKNNITKALKQKCQEASEKETLLLYYSGHGIHYKNKDYLVPSDAITNVGEEDFENSLVSCDLLDNIVDKSKAEAIIFFIDACRNGVDLKVKANYNMDWAVRWDKTQWNTVLKRQFLRVFSCSSGQYSRFGNKEKEGFSFFTKALATVLEPEYQAFTLDEILYETQNELNKLTDQFGKTKQNISWFGEERVENDILNFVLKTQPLVQSKSPTQERWRVEASQSALWNKDDSDTNNLLTDYKDSVGNIVNICWEKCEEARQAFEQDPWRDELFAIRMLKNLQLLILNSESSVNLSLAETSLVITAPFVYEAVLATALLKAAEFKLDILSIDENNSLPGGLQTAIKKVHRVQHRIVRKAKQFRDRGLNDECEALKAWLLYRCLFLTPEIWQVDVGSYLFQFANNLITISNQSKLSEIKNQEFIRILLDLAKCILAEPKSIDDYPSSKQIVYPNTATIKPVRMRMLGYLLKLAGLLAIDARKFSDVLVDNIGIVDKQTSSKEYQVTPEWVHSNINNINWVRSGSGYTLKGTCYHAALDFVLREHVEETTTVLDYILQQIEKRGIEKLSGLPTRFNAEGLTAAEEDNRPLYTRPHLYFRLAHDEIRELIMGKQLYEKPSLAIRELYQNALDACRYREARHKYFQQKPPDDWEKSWQGKIIFRQDKDEDGRPYIECEDNGIGMGKTQLTDCFTRAGRRFSDLPEFIEEQAEWLQCDPPIKIYPNSQFGVGVFSYFMLADELEVDTCRLERDGRPGRHLHIHIPGSSGLLRLQDRGFGGDAFTRVRLYLNQDNDKQISCLQTLKELLWVAEFSTEVHENGKREIWEPGKLHHPGLNDNQIISTGDPDIWWINYNVGRNKGYVLSDGLYIESDRNIGEKFLLTIINLQKEHLPKLTVNRLKFIDPDLDWVNEELSKNWQVLVNWENLTIQFLWRLELKYFDIARKVVASLCKNQTSVKLQSDMEWYHKGYDSSYQLDEQDKEYDPFDDGKIISWSPRDINIPVSEIGLSIIDGLISRFILEEKTSIKLSFNKIEKMSFIAPLWIFFYRVAILHQSKLEIPPLLQFLQETIIHFKAYNQLPPIFPEDECCLNIFYEMSSSGFQISSKKYESALHLLVLGAYKLNESVADILKRLERLFPLLNLGMIDLKKISQIDIECVKDLIPNKEDLFIFHQDFNGKSLWVEQTIPWKGILLAAAKFNKPIIEIYQRLEKFQPLGWQVPQVDFDAIKDFIPSKKDLLLLSKDFDGESPWVEESIPVANLLLAAKRSNKPVIEIHQQLKKFEEFGWQVPEIDFNGIEDFIPSEKDLVILSKNLEGDDHWGRWIRFVVEKRIPIAHLLLAAEKLNKPVIEIHQQLEKFQPFGWQVVPQVDFNAIEEDFIPSQEDLVLLSKNFDGESPWLEEGIPVAHLLAAAGKLNLRVIEIYERLQKFQLFGWQLPEVDLNTIRNCNFGKEYLHFLSRDLNFQRLLQQDIPSILFLIVATALDKSIAEVYQEFEKLKPLGFRLPKINLESEPNLIISKDYFLFIEKNLSLDSTNHDFYHQKIPAIHLLFLSARLHQPVAFVFKRSQLLASVLNLELPEVKSESELVENWVVSLRDFLILSENLNAEKPWIEDSFSLMHVIQFSARLNEPLIETLKYLQKFTEVGFKIPNVDDKLLPDNFTPNLKDLIAVSQDLDGLKPWIQGSVAEDHVTKAAKKLRESPEETLQRLKPFVPILDLNLKFS